MKRSAKYEAVLKRCFDLLVDNQEAYNFVIAYGEYVEIIDDMVDEEKNTELVAKFTSLATLLFSSNYWQKNGQQLILVEGLIHVMYFATVQWENAIEPWKRRDAKAMSHVGYYMLFAILLLETRDTKLVEEIALEFMECAHLHHFEDMSAEVRNS